jgi:hypothetical protein
VKAAAQPAAQLSAGKQRKEKETQKAEQHKMNEHAATKECC